MKSRTYTLFSSLVVLICILLVGIWGFLVEKSASYRTDIAALSEGAREALRKDSYALSIRTALRDVEGEIRAIDDQFIGENSIPGFMSLLESMAEARGVNINIGSIKLEPSSSASPVRVLAIRVDGTGQWQDLISFVADLEGMPFALSVQALSLRSGEKGWQLGADLTQFVSN